MFPALKKLKVWWGKCTCKLTTFSISWKKVPEVIDIGQWEGLSMPGKEPVAQVCPFELRYVHPSQQTHWWVGWGLLLVFLSHILFLPLRRRPFCIHTFVKYLNSLWIEMLEGKTEILLSASLGHRWVGSAHVCVTVSAGVDVNQNIPQVE